MLFDIPSATLPPPFLEAATKFASSRFLVQQPFPVSSQRTAIRGSDFSLAQSLSVL